MDLQSALALEPDHADALLQLGTAYEKLGALQHAYDTLSALIQIDPNNAKALYARGACLNLMGQDAKALGVLRSPDPFTLLLCSQHRSAFCQGSLHPLTEDAVECTLMAHVMSCIATICCTECMLHDSKLFVQRTMSLLWRRTKSRSGCFSDAPTKLMEACHRVPKGHLQKGTAQETPALIKHRYSAKHCSLRKALNWLLHRVAACLHARDCAGWSEHAC